MKITKLLILTIILYSNNAYSKTIFRLVSPDYKSQYPEELPKQNQENQSDFISQLESQNDNNKSTSSKIDQYLENSNSQNLNQSNNFTNNDIDEKIEDYQKLGSEDNIIKGNKSLSNQDKKEDPANINEEQSVSINNKSQIIDDKGPVDIKENKKQDNKKTSLPTVLKAKQITSDDNNIFIATGNVEITKEQGIMFADKITYDKQAKEINAIDNIKIKNIEIGNIFADKAKIKEDFSFGKFFDSQMILNDGSYMQSSLITRTDKENTIINDGYFSICPNPEISPENKILTPINNKNFFTIKAKEIKINRKTSEVRINKGVIRIYKLPVLYIPKFKLNLPPSDRKSGFLPPSYVNTNRFGVGIKIPYYLAFNDQMDLTITPNLHLTSPQLIVKNDFRHFSKYGEYKLSMEVANNKVESRDDNLAINRTNSSYRWNIEGDGEFYFNKNLSFDYKVNQLSDFNYLRDYHFNYINYTLSYGNLEYLFQKNYHFAKVIKIQELENEQFKNYAPRALPVLESHFETKPFLYKETIAITNNYTRISRQDGQEYQRLSTIPKIKLPANLYGNLFNLETKIQTDFYQIYEDKRSPSPIIRAQNNQLNYRPELSLNWRMPLLKRNKSGTITIEPMASFVKANSNKNYKYIANEDSNDSELTINNLMLGDRIFGFDRNEVGNRINYGIRSAFFHKKNEYRIALGQAIKSQEKQKQDIAIRGFNNQNISNIVGETYYGNETLTLNYNFQLNESSYRNDVNEIISSLNYKKHSASASYLLVRKNLQNLQNIEQFNVSSSFQINTKLRIGFLMNRDIILKRNIFRSIGLTYIGCCTSAGITISESNPSSLTKPQRSINFNFSIKNL